MKRNEKFLNAKIVNVIKVELIRGTGEKDDPVRNVIQYWDLKGNLIIDNDYCLDDKIESASSESNFKDM